MVQAASAFSTRLRGEPNAYDVAAVRNGEVDVRVRHCSGPAWATFRAEPDTHRPSTCSCGPRRLFSKLAGPLRAQALASFSVTTPPTIMATPAKRPSEVASPKKATPTAKVPAAPIPVQIA